MIYALISAIFSGIGSNVSKFVLGVLSGHQLLLVESLAMLVLLSWKKSSWSVLGHDRRDLSLLLLGSLLHGFAALLSYLSLSNLSVLEFSLVGRTQTLISILIGLLYFKDRLNFLEISAVVFAVAGLFICFYTGLDWSRASGLLCGIFYCILFACRSAFTKSGNLKIETLMFYGNLVGFILAVTFECVHRTGFSDQCMPVVGLCLLSTSLTQLGGVYLYYYSIRVSKFSVASTVRSLSPVFSILIAYFFFDCEWNKNKIWGWCLMGFSMSLFIVNSLKIKARISR